MFFVFCADRCFRLSQKQAGNETSGQVVYQTTGLSV